jgi:hypothetical protein
MIDNINNLHKEKNIIVQNIFKKYPLRIPVIVVKMYNSKLPSLKKNKFLVPSNMIFSEFKYIIIKNINNINNINNNYNYNETLYLLIDNIIPKTNQQMCELYDKLKWVKKK